MHACISTGVEGAELRATAGLQPAKHTCRARLTRRRLCRAWTVTSQSLLQQQELLTLVTAVPCPSACRVFPCATPAEVRSQLPGDTDVVAFQCRNPVHRAHYELFTRALHAPNVRPGAVCLVHPTCGPTQVRASPRPNAVAGSTRATACTPPTTESDADGGDCHRPLSNAVCV